VSTIAITTGNGVVFRAFGPGARVHWHSRILDQFGTCWARLFNDFPIGLV
jgi:hypothetical protein